MTRSEKEQEIERLIYSLYNEDGVIVNRLNVEWLSAISICGNRRILGIDYDSFVYSKPNALPTQNP